jgi:hypothetical protein
MKDFKTVPPPQKYRSLSEIYDTFQTRGVVAYGCKTEDGIPLGGYVVAVQDAPAPASTYTSGNMQNAGKTGTAGGIKPAPRPQPGIKEYLRQFKEKFKDKEPIFYMRVLKDETIDQILLTYDNGSGEKKALPKIEVKKSKEQKAVEGIPDEFLALALASSLRREER